MNFKTIIADTIAAAIGNNELTGNDIAQMLETPPTPQMGDYAFPCYRAAKVLKKAPKEIAELINSNITDDRFASKVVGGYLNFFVDKPLYAKTVLQSEYKSDAYSGVTIVIDYSSPNIAKPFHVAHVPTTVIGYALYNIYKYLGANVISVNHLGDWGTQFGKLIAAYKHWGNEEAVQKQGVAELTRLYVKFHEEADKNPALDDEARMYLVKMEQGDNEALSLWKWFSDISLDEYKDNTYKRLGITFDYYTGESFYNDKMGLVASLLREKGLLTESAGAMIVDLSEYDMPPCLILRSDGGTLYPTRDIAAALYRKENYNFDKCLYLTCMDQNLHFAQWFKVIELMGYDWASGLTHVPLGQISFQDGKLSTRKGNVILLEDLLNEAVAKTLSIINVKNPSLENKEDVAEAVGVGAVIFNNMYNSRIKDVFFTWDRVLNFEGESGPYVQYTHARACGILDKAGGITETNIDYKKLIDEYSMDVIRSLNTLNDAIVSAADKYEPYIVSRALVDICRSFNKFYNNNIVLTDDKDVQNARLALVARVASTLRFGLGLLGIKAPEKM